MSEQILLKLPDDPDKMLDTLMDMLTAAIRQTATPGRNWYRQSLYQALDNLVAARKERGVEYVPPPGEYMPDVKPVHARCVHPEDFPPSKEDDDPQDENKFSAESPKDPVQ